MDRYTYEDHDADTELATVESDYNDMIPEEFSEGPYSADLASESLSKNKPWRIDQPATGPFSYENKALHAGIPRDYPGEDNSSLSIPEVLDEP